MDVEALHGECSDHRHALLATEKGACFHCCEAFPSAEVQEWVDEDGSGQGQTALCPRCGIDAVLPWRPGIDRALLERMRARWF